MKKIIFKFWGQASWYNFVADVEESADFVDGNGECTVSYKTSSLNVGQPKEGILDSSDVARFINNLEDVHIENWDSQYEPEGEMIMDAGNYSICYVDSENNIYFTNCGDDCLPDTFESLIDAIGICDEDAAKYFDMSASLGEE